MMTKEKHQGLIVESDGTRFPGAITPGNGLSFYLENLLVKRTLACYNWSLGSDFRRPNELSAHCLIR